MSTAIGMLLGRLVASYGIVALTILLINKFRVKTAWRKLHTLWGMTAVAVTFLIPFLSSLGAKL